MGTSIDKLNYMSTTKTKIKDAINLTNVNITTDTFRSYETKFKQGIINTLNNPDAVWNNFTKVTGTGESLALTPTEHAPMVLTLKGQTTQASTPTPSSPQPINVVTGEQDINISSGINLLPNELPTTTAYGITITKNNDGTYTANGTATTDFSYAINNANFISLSGTWRVTGCPSGGSASTYMLSAYTGSWGTTSPYIDTGEGTNITYTGNVKIRVLIKRGTTCNNLLFKPMITTDTSLNYDDFQPYRITYEINLGNIELCKIGTYQDKIYKENGIWYLHKEIGKVVLNGSENWALNSYAQSQGHYVFGYRMYNVANENGAVLSDNFKYTNWATWQPNSISHSAHLMLIQLSDQTITTANAFKTYLGTHNTIVYYQLATPTNTPIEDSELLEQLNSTKSCDGVTNISQSSSYEVFILDAIAIREVE